MTDDELSKLIADDDLGLLSIKPKRTPQSTEEERLLEGFQQIVRFVETTGSAPTLHGDGMDERLLKIRLDAIRSSPALREKLTKFDEYDLLKAVAGEEVLDGQTPKSIDEILDDDFLQSLDSGAGDILTLRHVPAMSEKDIPDYIAQRTKCREFHIFEEQFKNCQQDLKAGRRRLLPFANEQQIEVGKFYVLQGVLLLVAEAGERKEKNGKWNARLRCIYENGTESDLLLRSLSRGLYKDGRRVTELDEALLSKMVVTEDDKAAGFIYVLRSLSTKPEITSIPNLYKVGLARRSIELRIQNAEQEPTYLMAPVALVSTFQCYNLNLPKLENLLHRFFDAAAVKVQVTDSQGNYHSPKEWFSVPLESIQTAVRLLISGEIVSYQYDDSTQQVVLRK